ncbi:ankyrin repeat and SOCS box protein 10 isoform X1 [Latimeria chalumnae]|uniref:ankyrin repeat and SOCS box protein 10 isoform X1 n=2 Tax=Latimeria chalumnae TaxID=7897 RepID=UPI0003C12673|nr:PREDICTED: ankyrin repeat and SOCS box protein 10 isoform X1 [Latimeria chalumnae]|eukprot:XP_006007161.1 PREDICTED: ankyrin repeat and SOCS box protein 10 isoform X1 [Latimeria chalumnae]
MSFNTFVFTSSALRSLRLERDLLEVDRSRRKKTSSQYPNPFLKWRKVEKEPGFKSTNMEPMVCQDLLVQNALFTGDLEKIRELFTKHSAINLIIEARGGELRWTSKSFGLWSLTYEEELTTPLHITASRGYADCLKHLLLRGAEVDFAPGGKTALHEACNNANTECARLLLLFGANPNKYSENGLFALHYCVTSDSLQCAKILLEYGANINSKTEEKKDTPLHIAARHGLEEHLKLYLRHGAVIDKENNDGMTPLSAACYQSHKSEDIERYYGACKYLIDYGANIKTEDRDKQTPLHLACKTANHKVVDLLLQKGASVNTMSYSGNAPLQNILQKVSCMLDYEPERIVRSLLNYGSIRIWPGALPKVLKYCCPSPRTIEVLINTYDRIRINEKWVNAVPLNIYLKHQDFYDSLFALDQTPRSLQHLARCAVRTYLNNTLQTVVPKLHLPTYLQNYLLLEFEDYLY